MLRAEFLERIDQVEASAWDRLFRTRNPFVRHAFLSALESSGCVGPGTGWQPCHLVLRRGEAPVAAMPLYRKSHSYGEFVFDWAWAEAYSRHGLRYYPKLVSAIPFTPSTGPRLGAHRQEDPIEVAAELVRLLKDRCESLDCSGWHVLFPDAELKRALRSEELMSRHDVQFHWHNRSYADFDAFLAALRSSRRKNIRKERSSLKKAGVSLRRVDGADITDAEWRGFFHCYRQTYLKRSGHEGYLNEAFFECVRDSMPNSLLLVVAEREGMMIASALFFFDERSLFGRYWGALEPVDYLHFECCFYQGIEFCIERGIVAFDPGTQGEHKLLRGFEPVRTTSLHWIRDPRFRAAIAASLEHEKERVDDYRDEAGEFLPYRRDRAFGGGPT